MVLSGQRKQSRKKPLLEHELFFIYLFNLNEDENMVSSMDVLFYLYVIDFRTQKYITFVYD